MLMDSTVLARKISIYLLVTVKEMFASKTNTPKNVSIIIKMIITQ